MCVSVCLCVCVSICVCVCERGCCVCVWIYLYVCDWDLCVCVCVCVCVGVHEFVSRALTLSTLPVNTTALPVWSVSPDVVPSSHVMPIMCVQWEDRSIYGAAVPAFGRIGVSMVLQSQR